MKKTIEKIMSLIDRNSLRRTAEHEEFLIFLENIVVSASPDVAKSFGHFDVGFIEENGNQGSMGIELTAADLLYWRNAIGGGVRFIDPVSKVKRDIFDRLSRSAGSMEMTSDEKAEFIKIMKSES